jgi:hypothetical protein
LSCALKEDRDFAALTVSGNAFWSRATESPVTIDFSLNLEERRVRVGQESKMRSDRYLDGLVGLNQDFVVDTWAYSEPVEVEQHWSEVLVGGGVGEDTCITVLEILSPN